tara:strand:- start:9 stop:467 length:459 start_codon:yes stop_codon:yes gene_type:complete
MKSKEEHEEIFKSYPAAKLKDIIKKSNISLSGLSKGEIVSAMMKRRKSFDWLEKYYGVDSYKQHPRYKKLSGEKDKEQAKISQKPKQKPTTTKVKFSNFKINKPKPTYTDVDGGEKPSSVMRNSVYQSVQPVYTEVSPRAEDSYTRVYPDPD